MEMKDYSQYGEQGAILKAIERLGGAGQKSFLDIGAYHPTVFSNTRALFELGWRGVMIEPSPGPMLSLLKEYGEDDRITLIQACVGHDLNHWVELQVSDDAVSTTDKGVFEQWKGTAKYYGSMLVPAITLHEIANRFSGFDFVNIDAEGVSVDIFRDMLDLGMFPPVVCCEHDGRLVEILELATRQHYSGVFSNATNVVLAR